MRKYLLAILSAVCIACTAFAFGCTDTSSVEPNYFKVEYNENQAGITLVFDDVKYEVDGDPEPFASGAWVKEGLELQFSMEVDENLYNPEDLQVTANSEVLVKDENGKYSFKVNADTVILVQSTVTEKKITLCKGAKKNAGDVPSDRIRYFDKDGNEFESEFITNAEQLTFSVKVSSYYRLQEGYENVMVTASTRIVTPDEDGFYTIELDGDTVVEVQGYEQDESFAERPDGGSGTKKDPFILKTPIDLYQVAGIINSDWYQGHWSSAYYELANDIDLDGEQLFIIGDAVTTYSYFSGSFDGKGHTISNFYIQDSVIDQESFTPIDLIQVGMFGWVRTDGVNVPVIKNLNLKDYTIDVYKNGNYSFYVGSIVGYMDGGSVINCSASGNVNVSTAGGDYVGYAGGLVGVASSNFEEDVTSVELSIIGCTSNVELRCLSGHFYAAGGIVGFLNAMAEKTPSYITDCANSGDVSGAMRTGGIVGYLSPYASVNNCLSTAKYIDARCDLQGASNASMRYAYAGGIVGYAEHESLIYGCYSASDTSATSVNGASYQRKGSIIGAGAEANSDYVESHSALVVNSYSAPAMKFTENLLKNTLNWNTENWKLQAGAEYPVVSVSVEGSTVAVTGFNVNVNFAGNQTVNGKAGFTYTAKEYGSMAKIYLGGGMQEYLSADSKNMRTYGYFFDEAHTQRVLCSFVPTSDITIYAGFADYGEISGKYYLRINGNEGSGAYFDLGEDGTLLFRSGAVHFDSTYVYDGENVLLMYNPAFLVSVTNADGSVSTTMYCGIGTLNNGVLSVYDNHNYNQGNTLNAKREIEGFAYGTYYTATVEYTFNGDGTVIKSGAVLDYSVSGNTLTIINGLQNETVVLNGGVPVSVNGMPLSAVDRFEGVWETGMLGTTRYNFDGKGSYSYESYGYLGGRKTNVVTGEGKYNLTDGKIVLDNGEEITVNENGFIEIGGVEYYRQSSFTGSWRFFARSNTDVVELKLLGINIDGYGVAEVKFGTSRDVFILNYEAGIIEGESSAEDVEYIRLFYLSGVVGTLEFNAADLTLSGSFNGAAGCKFCLYDSFAGEWVSEEFGLISFNGLGLYNRLTGSNITIVQGNVRANGELVGHYLLESGTASGTLTYNGKNYNIAYNKDNDSIIVSDGENTFALIHIDGWVEAKLVDSDGKIYTFDGLGNLASGGSVLVDGVETYKYFNNSDGSLKIVLGNEEGSFVASEGKYVLSVGNTRKELTLYNVFTGTWQVSGTPDGRIVIGTLGIDNKAQGYYLGTEVEFEYSDGILSFNYEGKTLYVISFSTFGRYKFAISEYETTAYGVLHYCVTVGDVDEFAGEYSSANSGSMILDGFSNGTLGYGSAFMYNAQGEQTAVYSYRIVNRVYQGVEITLNDDSKLLLVERNAGEYKHDGKSYDLVTPDELYPGTYYTNYAVELNADNEAIAYYIFDGIGRMAKVSDVDDEYYTYKITGKNENRREIYIELVSEKDGSKYTAVLDYSQSTETPLFTMQGAGENA